MRAFLHFLLSSEVRSRDSAPQLLFWLRPSFTTDKSTVSCASRMGDDAQWEDYPSDFEEYSEFVKQKHSRKAHQNAHSGLLQDIANDHNQSQKLQPQSPEPVRTKCDSILLWLMRLSQLILLLFILSTAFSGLKYSLTKDSTADVSLLNRCDKVRISFQGCSFNVADQPLCVSPLSGEFEQDVLLSSLITLPALPPSAPDLDQVLSQNDGLTDLVTQNLTLGSSIRQHLHQTTAILQSSRFSEAVAALISSREDFRDSIHDLEVSFNHSATEKRLDQAFHALVDTWSTTARTMLSKQQSLAQDLLPELEDVHFALQWAEIYTQMLIVASEQWIPAHLLSGGSMDLRSFLRALGHQRAIIEKWVRVLTGLLQEASHVEQRIYSDIEDKASAGRVLKGFKDHSTACWIRLRWVISDLKEAAKWV